MKLKKLIALEIASIFAILVIFLLLVEVTPYLTSSEGSDSIGVYKQKSYPKGNVSLATGQSVFVPLNYSSYDPAIIVLDVSFLTCDKPGYFALYCNYRTVVSLFVNPQTPPLTLNLISFSGLDWVEPPSSMGGLNDLLFESQSQNGYSGKISYQITLKGSR